MAPDPRELRLLILGTRVRLRAAREPIEAVRVAASAPLPLVPVPEVLELELLLEHDIVEEPVPRVEVSRGDMRALPLPWLHIVRGAPGVERQAR